MSQPVTIPGLFIPHIELFVADHGGDVAALYSSAGIDRESFDSQQRLDEDRFYRFVFAAQQQSKQKDFGIQIGKRFSLNSFGLLSQAVMSCRDLRTALRLIERYSTLAMPLLHCSSKEDDEFLYVELKPLSKYPWLNQVIVEALLSSWRRAFRMLTGNSVSIEKALMSYPEPDYVEQYKTTQAKSLVFDNDKNVMILRRQYADLPFLTANPTDAKITKDECESALLQDQQDTLLSQKVSEQIRSLLAESPSGKQIAQRLNLTERTMRRRLSEEETSFRDLLTQARKEMATHYLHDTELQIAQIALKLGYQETSNFRSAFKQWTGYSPREWRNKNAK